MILSSLLQSLIMWFFNICLSMYSYIADVLLDVFGCDINYFKDNVPVMGDIMNILLAVGWALLLGNLVFQAMKGMMSGMGFESEPPQILFGRTFVFSFLLLASPQICELGTGITGNVIALLKLPMSADIQFPQESDFSFPFAWVLVLIVDAIMIYQVLRLFLLIAERYVLISILTILSPLAFAMGGSKQTEELFKGWVRLFGSVCLMMVINVVALKIMLSGLAAAPAGPMVIIWIMLMIGLGRGAKKLDDIASRVGLNTTRTGEAMSRSGIPGMMAMAAIRMATKQVGGAVNSHAKVGGKDKSGQGGSQSPSGKAGGEKVKFFYADGSMAGEGTATKAGKAASGAENIPEERPTRPPVGRRARPAPAGGTNPQSSGSPQTTSTTPDNTARDKSPQSTTVIPGAPSTSQVNLNETPARPPVRRGGQSAPAAMPTPGKPGAETQSANNAVKPRQPLGGIAPATPVPNAENTVPAVNRPPVNAKAADMQGSPVSARQEGAITANRPVGNTPSHAAAHPEMSAKRTQKNAANSPPKPQPHVEKSQPAEVSTPTGKATQPSSGNPGRISQARPTGQQVTHPAAKQSDVTESRAVSSISSPSSIHTPETGNVSTPAWNYMAQTKTVLSEKAAEKHIPVGPVISRGKPLSTSTAGVPGQTKKNPQRPEQPVNRNTGSVLPPRPPEKRGR